MEDALDLGEVALLSKVSGGLFSVAADEFACTGVFCDAPASFISISVGSVEFEPF
jgi:hypothetical protein